MSQKKGLFRDLKRWRNRCRQERRYWRGLRQGEYVLPPPSLKLAIMTRNVPQPRPRVFVETGTYHGDTVAAMRPYYDRVISIEVDETLYRRACARFAGDTNVQIVHGDCIRELPAVLAQLTEPAVFWLDGHYSGGGTGQGEIAEPVLVSLDQLAGHPVKKHVLFVDDARYLDGREGRPDLAAVFAQLKQINPHYTVRVQCDIVIATVNPIPVQTV
jgi:hypothetical protein